jgi:hypothetical protein
VAGTACDAEEWLECATALDKASKLDPEGSLSRSAQRLQKKARRGIIEESVETKPGPLAPPRSLTAEQTARLAATLRSEGRSATLVCTPGAEPKHLCDQLGSALAKAGWVVSREPPAGGATTAHGLRVEVATDADEGAQAAADALAEALADDTLAVRGPDDMAPAAGGTPLRITVGAQ